MPIGEGVLVSIQDVSGRVFSSGGATLTFTVSACVPSFLSICMYTSIYN